MAENTQNETEQERLRDLTDEELEVIRENRLKVATMILGHDGPLLLMAYASFGVVAHMLAAYPDKVAEPAEAMKFLKATALEFGCPDTKTDEQSWQDFRQLAKGMGFHDLLQKGA